MNHRLTRRAFSQAAIAAVPDVIAVVEPGPSVRVAATAGTVALAAVAALGSTDGVRARDVEASPTASQSISTSIPTSEIPSEWRGLIRAPAFDR